MQNKLFLLCSALLSFALLAAACSNDDNTDTQDDASDTALISLEQECDAWGGIQAPAGFRVNMVTDIGKIDDGTFNEFAYEGMVAAAECFDIKETGVIETASEADYTANLNTSASENPDVLITVGFLIGTDTLEAANENPDISYIGVDQFHPEYPNNYIGVLFNEHEGGFIAGALAASLSETGVIGVVGGVEIPPVVKFLNGYEAGAKHINPNISVLKVYNESFADPAKGASDARQFIGEGADVVFGAGGPTGSGGIKAAAEAGAFAIGVDQDEYYTTFDGGNAPGSENLVSSAIKRVDLSVFRNIGEAVRDTFSGGAYTLTVDNMGITYAPFHDAAVSPEVAATVERVRAGLADGSIETGICAIDGLFLGENSACD
ncbi:MAG: BMP family ABC transporter substrate-binding protein [Acidimicrobiia bacterium]|nr:BMP family ABC transporter substrate-binding protein [Acidimicrobiia bacterium]MYC57863.1 BMP family ABC transporter substrate-binding protein [Acidimicrobiia bacterium]MYI31186.1 BMP family ABC transporter substrate-binding protein [Acidimicrobiia bacterium]